MQRWRWRPLHASVLQQTIHLCHLPQRAWTRGLDDNHDTDTDNHHHIDDQNDDGHDDEDHNDDHNDDHDYNDVDVDNHHHDDNHYDDDYHYYHDCHHHHQVVHKYIGQEPSGRNFNEICLDKSGKWQKNWKNYEWFFAIVSIGICLLYFESISISKCISSKRTHLPTTFKPNHSWNHIPIHHNPTQIHLNPSGKQHSLM